LCAGGVRRDELLGGGVLRDCLVFCFCNGVGGGGGPWLRNAWCDGRSDMLDGDAEFYF